MLDYRELVLSRAFFDRFAGFDYDGFRKLTLVVRQREKARAQLRRFCFGT